MRTIRLSLVLLVAAFAAGSAFASKLWLARGASDKDAHGARGVEREGHGKAKKGKSKPKGEAATGDANSPFASSDACKQYVAAHPRVPRRSPRVGSWNVRWFPLGSKDGHDPERHTDLEWLACAISSLDVDMLAVQEFTQDEEGRAALLDLLSRLDAQTHGHWRAELDDCDGTGRQHVGFLLDQTRVELKSSAEVSALNPGPTGCDRSLRPGYGAYVHFIGGPDVQVVVVHLDSGDQERDYKNRVLSISRIGAAGAELQRKAKDSDLIVLGDFNTMGCKDCAHELSAEQEVDALDAKLSAMGLRRVALPEDTQCTYYHHGHPDTLDHVLVNLGMEELAEDSRVEVHGLCRDFGCKSPTRAGKRAAFERLSDHCPIVVELSENDLDRGPLVTTRAVTPTPQ